MVLLFWGGHQSLHMIYVVHALVDQLLLLVSTTVLAQSFNIISRFILWVYLAVGLFHIVDPSIPGVVSRDQRVLAVIKILVGNEVTFVKFLFDTGHIPKVLEHLLVEADLVVQDVFVHQLLVLHLLLHPLFIAHLLRKMPSESLVFRVDVVPFIPPNLFSLLDLLLYHVIRLLEDSFPIVMLHPPLILELGEVVLLVQERLVLVLGGA